MNFKTERKITYDLINFDILVIPKDIKNNKGKVEMPVKGTSFFIKATKGSVSDSEVKQKLTSSLLKSMGFQSDATATLVVKVSAMYSNKERKPLGEFKYKLAKGIVKI